MYVRQGWNAQDPLSSCYHYLFCMYVVLPAIFGIRMCFQCPDCANTSSEFGSTCACSDYLGSNAKAMGGYAGIATAMAFATEYQGLSLIHI